MICRWILAVVLLSPVAMFASLTFLIDLKIHFKRTLKGHKELWIWLVVINNGAMLNQWRISICFLFRKQVSFRFKKKISHILWEKQCVLVFKRNTFVTKKVTSEEIMVIFLNDNIKSLRTETSRISKKKKSTYSIFVNLKSFILNINMLTSLNP